MHMRPRKVATTGGPVALALLSLSLAACNQQDVTPLAQSVSGLSRIWTNIPIPSGTTVGLSDIGVNSGVVWGVNPYMQIFKWNGSGWVYYSNGYLSVASVQNDGKLWGTQDVGNVYAYDGATWTGGWGVSAKDVAAGGGQVWMVQKTTGKVLRYSSAGNLWVQSAVVPGTGSTAYPSTATYATYATALDVDDSGLPWVVQNGCVMTGSLNGQRWTPQGCPNAVDIGVGTQSGVAQQWVTTSTPGHTLQYWDTTANVLNWVDEPNWYAQSGYRTASKVAMDTGTGNLWVLASDYTIWKGQ